MDQNLVTAGEFAKLSQTTKRTVLWYNQKGILKPVKVNAEGYRFYSPSQIIDFQVIMLLRRLNFSISEIKKLLSNNSSLQELFKLQGQLVKKQISKLEKNMSDITNFYSNLEKEGVLVKPIIKTVKQFEMFYLEKIGPYSKIYAYCQELKSYFSKIPSNATFLTLFPGKKYLPHNDRFKVGVIKTDQMKLKNGAENRMKREKVPAFKSLTYTHIGSPALLSMMIKQLEKYRDDNALKTDQKTGINQLEFYIKSGLNDFHNEDFMVSEINLPIE